MCRARGEQRGLRARLSATSMCCGRECVEDDLGAAVLTVVALLVGRWARPCSSRQPSVLKCCFGRQAIVDAGPEVTAALREMRQRTPGALPLPRPLSAFRSAAARRTPRRAGPV